jgi:predicted MPP superfamily phosphohydrolase
MRWPEFHEQLLSALLFVAAVAVVFLLAAWVLAAALYRRLAHKPAPRRFRWVRRAVVVLAVVELLCVAYGYFIEPYWLEVTRVCIPTAKLPAGARPIRIVHISDLHCESKTRLEERLPPLIADLKPDLIAFTGDAINSKAGIETFRRCLVKLTAIAPVFGVQGNSDLWQGLEGGIPASGARELDGEAVKVELEGRELYVIGSAVNDWPRVKAALATVPPEALKVVLYHYPDEIPAAAELGVDLFLAGHTHGGQVALPFYGALVTLATHGKRFESGLYRLGRMYAYVNRGIGMEGGIVPRVRFCARPEVTVIELVGELR